MTLCISSGHRPARGGFLYRTGITMGGGGWAGLFPWRRATYEPKRAESFGSDPTPRGATAFPARVRLRVRSRLRGQSVGTRHYAIAATSRSVALPPSSGVSSDCICAAICAIVLAPPHVERVEGIGRRLGKRDQQLWRSALVVLNAREAQPKSAGPLLFMDRP